MRESDHDCVQSREDFTYTTDTNEPAIPQLPATDAATVDNAKKNQGSGLDSLGGGRLD